MRLSKRAKRIMALALVVAISAALFASLFYAPQASFSVPAVNAYDDFVRAATYASDTLKSPQIRRIYEAAVVARSKEDLRDWMIEGGAAIAAFEDGLAKPSCCVPVQTTKEFEASHVSTLGQLKLLTHFLLARSQLAALERRTNEALMADLQAYDFAKRIGNGGLMTDYLVSRSCQAIVLKHLESLVPSLNQRECSDALTVLASTNYDETAATVVARAISWERAVDAPRWAKARMAFWVKTIVEIAKTRSLAPLDALPKRRLEKSHKNINATLESVRWELRRQREIPVERGK